MKNKIKSIDADAKHALSRGNDVVETGSVLNLDKGHKDWYNRGQMGKMRGKPKYAPPNQKKTTKYY